MKKTLLSVLVASAFAMPAMAETEVSGLIEVEAGFNDDTSDISLATVELGIAHAVNDKVEGSLLFLYEEGENDDNIAVDEAIITLHASKNIDINAGRMYVPFGNYETMMVSDPLTLEIGETQEEAVQVAFSTDGGVGGSAYVFKDDEDGSDKIDDFGMNVGYASDAFNVGVSYISDVNDKSDANNKASGVSVYANGTIGSATVIAEYLKVDTTAAGESPKATNLEVGFDLGNDRTLAVSAQGTDDAASLDLPEKAMGIAYSMPVYENTSFAAEYMKTEAYDDSDDSTVTLQLAYEF